MPEFNTEREINAPAGEVWKSVSDFGGIHKLIPMLAGSEATGNEPGCTRTCTLEDGGKIHERLESIDHEARELEYSISESPLPVENYRAKMKVTPLGDGKCRVGWGAVFECPVDAGADVEAMLSGVFNSGLETLDKTHAG